MDGLQILIIKPKFQGIPKLFKENEKYFGTYPTGRQTIVKIQILSPILMLRLLFCSMLLLSPEICGNQRY